MGKSKFLGLLFLGLFLVLLNINGTSGCGDNGNGNSAGSGTTDSTRTTAGTAPIADTSPGPNRETIQNMVAAMISGLQTSNSASSEGSTTPANNAALATSGSQAAYVLNLNDNPSPSSLDLSTRLCSSGTASLQVTIGGTITQPEGGGDAIYDLTINGPAVLNACVLRDNPRTHSREDLFSVSGSVSIVNARSQGTRTHITQTSPNRGTLTFTALPGSVVCSQGGELTYDVNLSSEGALAQLYDNCHATGTITGRACGSEHVGCFLRNTPCNAVAVVCDGISD